MWGRAGFEGQALCHNLAQGATGERLRATLPIDMDESKYLQLVDKAFRKIQDAFEDVDPDEADCYMAGDVLTVSFKNGVKCVINTQRPTRQIWCAARADAWHLSYDDATGRWMDDKGRGHELFALVRSVVKENAGVQLALASTNVG